MQAVKRRIQSPPRMDRDGLYREVTEKFGAALGRLAGGYEAEPERRSLELFDGKCSLRTWAYRVAHNVATSHLVRHAGVRFVELEEVADEIDLEATVGRSLVMQRVKELIHSLPPLERQLILLYLEGLDAASMAEITGLSSGNVATRVHRIKGALARRFHRGSPS